MTRDTQFLLIEVNCEVIEEHLLSVTSVLDHVCQYGTNSATLFVKTPVARNKKNWYPLQILIVSVREIPVFVHRFRVKFAHDVQFVDRELFLNFRGQFDLVVRFPIRDRTVAFVDGRSELFPVGIGRQSQKSTHKQQYPQNS